MCNFVLITWALGEGLNAVSVEGPGEGPPRSPREAVVPAECRPSRVATLRPTPDGHPSPFLYKYS